MVRALLACMLLSIACTVQAMQLGAKLDRRDSRLGEPVVLHLEAKGRNVSLENIDLSGLAADFDVLSITRSATDELAQLDATLYPLRVGALTVPALDVDGARSKPLTLHVADDPDLALSVTFTPDALFERQRSILLVSIRDKADRQWPMPTKPESPDLLLRALGERQFEEGSADERVTVHEFRWEALALKAGHHALRLPMLDVYQLGRRLRFPLPAAHLEVHALPGYLPVAVPVGKPGLSTEFPVAEGKVGEPMLWTLHVSAPGFSAEAARSLLHLPSGDQFGLRFYPPGFQRGEASDQGPRALRIQIPIVPATAGALRLPDIRLPYFDPRTMRMEQVSVEGPRFIVIDPFRKKALGAASVVLLIVATGFALHRSRKRWERRQARRVALNHIKEASTAGELVQAVCAFSAAPHPHTLRQWLSRQPEQQGLQGLAQDLEMACFGVAAQFDLVSSKRRWLAALSKRPII